MQYFGGGSVRANVYRVLFCPFNRLHAGPDRPAATTDGDSNKNTSADQHAYANTDQHTYANAQSADSKRKPVLHHAGEQWLVSGGEVECDRLCGRWWVHH